MAAAARAFSVTAARGALRALRGSGGEAHGGGHYCCWRWRRRGAWSPPGRPLSQGVPPQAPPVGVGLTEAVLRDAVKQQQQVRVPG